MKYEMMISPFEYCEFTSMKKKEVRLYFEWFVKQVERRIELLQNFLKEENFESELDFSSESLIPLWEWYEKKISFVQKDAHEYYTEISKYPNWMQSEISATKISIETLTYALDVSMYFAETVIRNSNGKIKWGYFTNPKNRMSVNQPTLLGFKDDMDLNPRLIVLNCTRRSGKETMSSRLFDMYNNWMLLID